MEKKSSILTHGIDNIEDRVKSCDEIINYLSQYRTMLQIIVLSEKHMAINDDLPHEEIKTIIKQYMGTLPLYQIQEWTKNAR